MGRMIVQSIDDMPGQGGVPLGCLVETGDHEPIVVAYGLGGTFSREGLTRIAPDMCEYTAYFDIAFAFDIPLQLRAVDIDAATTWLRAHHKGPFCLTITPNTTYLGRFEEEGITRSDLTRGLLEAVRESDETLAQLFVDTFGPQGAGAEARRLVDCLTTEKGGQS